LFPVDLPYDLNSPLILLQEDLHKVVLGIAGNSSDPNEPQRPRGIEKIIISAGSPV
jgi:hypothetical protein